MRLCALLIALLACGCVSAPVQRADQPSGRRALTVFYTADAHGRIVSDGAIIGLDHIAALKRSLPGSILLDAGDFMHGLPLVNMGQGKDAVRLMRAAGYDAATLGNHEFSHGMDALRARLDEAAVDPRLPLLSANIRKGSGTLLSEPYTRIERGDVSVCVFGLTTPETTVSASPSAVRDLIFCDPLETADVVTRQLRGQGCDVVIALAHLGSTPSSSPSSLDLGRAVPDIDLIIDGHSHVELDHRPSAGPPVFSSGAHGHKIGRVDIHRQADGSLTMSNRLLSPDDLRSTLPDRDLALKLAALSTEQEQYLNEIVAHSPGTLSGERDLVRTREMPLGNLCADALRSAYGTDIALMNGGGIRASLDKGPVTRKDIASVLAFGGNAIALRLRGQELIDVLEHAYSALPHESGAFLQVSGCTVVLGLSDPPGERVRSVTLPTGPLDLAVEYTVTVNDFLAEGGDGMPHLAGKAHVRDTLTMWDALIPHLDDHASGTPPAPVAHGRRIVQLQ